MIVLWLLVGIASVSIAFFIPANSPDVWPGLNAAAIPLAVYLIALVFTTLRSPISVKARIIAWTIVLVVGAANVWSWVGWDSESHWQHAQLLRIREVIVRGIMQTQVPDPLLKTLEAYHAQGGKKKESLAQVFRRLNDHATVGTDLRKPDTPGDSLSYVVQTLANDTIVVIGEHAYCTGKDPAFRNRNGRTGMVQARCTLTEKGVTYESEN